MRHHERELQKAIVHALRVALPPSWVCIHVPNGGLRTKAEASIFKGMGVQPGVPDLILFGETEGWGASTFFVEVKADAGRLTSAQVAMHERLRDLGFPVAVVRSLDDVSTACKQWRIPLRGALA